jgi:hypothetical protein
MKRSSKSTSAQTRITRAEELRLGKEYMLSVLEDREWFVEEDSPGTIAVRKYRSVMNKWTPEQRKKHKLRTDRLLRELGFGSTPAKPPVNISVLVETKRRRKAK